MVIYTISPTKPVGPSAVAKKREICRVSAHEVMKRLVKKSLGKYVDGKGIVLNDTGRKLARYYIWKHRTVETYFYWEFSIPKEDACAKASDIDIDIDENITLMMYEKLGCPCRCPCGYEIPNYVEVKGYDEKAL